MTSLVAEAFAVQQRRRIVAVAGTEGRKVFLPLIRSTSGSSTSGSRACSGEAAAAATALRAAPLDGDDGGGDGKEEAAASPAVSGGDATVADEIVNLVKGLVGAGCLSLPAGIAAFGNAPSAVVPGVVLIALVGSVSAYSFGLIGRVCHMTSKSGSGSGSGTNNEPQSFADAWRASVSPGSSWIVAWSAALITFSAALAYSMILGDTFQALASTAGLAVSKAAVLSVLTGGVLLPLCLLKNLKGLAPFSLLGSLGMIYTVAAMIARLLGKSYALPGGKFARDMPAHLRPQFGTLGARGAFTPNVGILVGMLSTAYMAHFNAPKFYHELQNNTVPRFMKVVTASFGVSIALFATLASVGFLTFGQNAAGLILNNYSNQDALMGLSRIAVAVSLVFAYPLVFTGMRDGFLDCFQVPAEKRTNKLLNTWTVGLLSLVSATALVAPDLGFVLAFSGATLGNALIYVFPYFMFRGAVQKMQKAGKATKGQRTEVWAALVSAMIGVVMGAVGTKQAIQSIL